MKTPQSARRIAFLAHSLTSACALTAGTALAADPPVYVMENGVARFEHVRVVNAPIATSPTNAQSMGGLRAYVDSDTGALRQPNAEELQAAAAEGARDALVSAQTVPTPRISASGGLIVPLDESQMQFFVVVRQPDGTLAQVCVTGAAEAARLVRHRSEPNAAPVQGDVR